MAWFPARTHHPHQRRREAVAPGLLEARQHLHPPRLRFRGSVDHDPVTQPRCQRRRRPTRRPAPRRQVVDLSKVHLAQCRIVWRRATWQRGRHADASGRHSRGDKEGAVGLLARGRLSVHDWLVAAGWPRHPRFGGRLVAPRPLEGRQLRSHRRPASWPRFHALRRSLRRTRPGLRELHVHGRLCRRHVCGVLTINRPCYNIVFRNCIIETGPGTGIKIVDAGGTVHDIRFENCLIKSQPCMGFECNSRPPAGVTKGF